jgi:hypothetical protein
MNAQTQANISVFEQVYTSASALLDRTHGDLGVVCETVGFPREIQTDLDRLNSYQPLESLSGESSDKHPAAYTLAVRGPQGSFYSISRTVFAGADHTGRTNPLAHHFVVPTEAARRTSTPADLLHSLCPHFLRQWESEPRRKEHPTAVQIVKRLDSGQTFPSAAWPQLASSERIAEILGFFAEHMTSSVVSADVSVVFVIPTSLGDDACRLLSDLLAVVPETFAFSISARTHVLSPPSIAGQCRVMFTYTNTAFLIQTRRRQDDDRPVIIDLAGGESSELQFEDYGEKIKGALIAGASAHDIKLLVDLRAQMGVMQNSGGTPFSDFAKVQQLLRSPEPMHNVDAILRLLENIARASKSAESVVADLLANVVDMHFDARKADSDWHALATLAISNCVPDKPQQRAELAIEECITLALPVVFEHPLLAEKLAGKTSKWLKKCVERKDVVSAMIRYALQHQTPQNFKCVRKTLRRLKPSATPDDFYNWGRILQESEGPAVQPIRKLVGEFAALKISSALIAPLRLKRAIPQIIEDCEQSERNQILFEFIEASATTNQLRDFVQFVAETFGTGDDFITGYDISEHSSSIVRAAIENAMAPRDYEMKQPPRTPERSQWENIDLKPTKNNRNLGLTNDEESWPSTLKKACPWVGAILTGLILVAFLVFMFEFKEWWPTVRRPKSWPTMIQWHGLLSFPLSVAFSGVMYWLVWRNKDHSRIRRSILYLVAALFAMFAGAASTLYTGFQWLHR